ncbi:NfeD family protein [Devosia sp.]|uniref:NfeD family protein n=1 Tax=Devosia sp. TaxID=1871048 RepID=UPI001AC1458C|nr:NfeD family protein [Devosia sp.]MBN9335449.1 NfeD family protein [Devosia sp.]
MVLIDFLAANAPWAWIIAGLILLALELVVPGGFLLWLGIAGLITGLVVLFQPIAWPFQWLMFGVLALVAIFIWTRWTRNRAGQSDRPYLNRRTDTFIGHEAVLEQPITDGFGRLALGDTIWRISGPDLPAGQKIRVVGSDGAVLRVEAI